MKKLILLFTMIFVTGVSALSAADLREVIFGNNWANINEITDDELMTAYKNCRYVKVYNRNHFNDFHLYEEKYGKESVYRFVASKNPLTYENAVKGYRDGTGQLWQALFVKKDGKLIELAAEYIFNRASGDGTVRFWVEDQYGGIEVIARGCRVLGVLSHKYASRMTHHGGEEGDIGYDSYEKETEASFYLWSDLQNDSYFEKKDDGIFYPVCDRGDSVIPDITISCSFPLIEAKHPFKYTLQNAFDANPATSFVEDTEDNSTFIHLFPDSFPACKKIKLINGYAQNQQLYQNNNRVKSIADRKDTQRVTLKDNTLESQIFDWKDYSIHSTDLYKGTKYNDTCLAEVDFMTEAGEWIFGE